MTMYCWYQTEPKSVWHLALASERANIMKTKRPALMTCLDADNDFNGSLSSDELMAVRYFGDYYADFDSETLEIAIEQFKKFLTLLKSKDVDLNQLRLYATGGRGFHLHIPQAMFMPRVNPAGVAGLPHIYKEMSFALYVDDLDLRTYTAKKGRQFRCVNVQRESGTYKVQISADEAMSMTVGVYEQLCSAPRNELPVDPPNFNAELGLLYATAKDKVEKALVKRKAKKQASNQLTRFKGAWPDTAEMIFNGVGLKPDVGWNGISFQLAVLASELGKSEEELLAAAEPLINEHRGDSSRYNTPAKRREDLRTMYRYTNGSPLYEFSPGGILALLMPEVRANADISFGDYVPDEPKTTTTTKTTVKEDGTTETETVVEVVEEDDNGPIRISKAGVFVRGDNSWVTASEIGMADPIILKKQDNTAIGYDLDVFLNNKPLGRHVITMDKLGSKASFQSWTMQWSASMSASDTQTAKIADVLRKRAERTDSVTYVVTREGVDLIVPPGAKSEADFELIWSCPDKVISQNGTNYRFRSHLDKNGTFKSDLMEAPPLTKDDEELIEHLLHINTTQNLAKLLGWFSATFLTQVIRRFYRQFPSLQMFGQSGAGKSKTAGLLNHLHYYMRDPKQFMAQGMTTYPMLVAVASSASQVVIFEEVKAREMTKTLKDFLLNLFRNNYDGNSMARGALTKDQSSKDVTVNEFENSGPIAFVGEAIEDQSAILERCIIVALSKSDRYGKHDNFHFVSRRRTELGKLGRAMVESVMALEIKQFREEFDGLFDQVCAALGDKAEEVERPAFNMTVVLMGLKLMSDTLRQTFGSRFDERFEEMRDSILGNMHGNLPVNMAEASRVLDIMAQLSRHQDPQYQLIKGQDYTLADNGLTMDLKLRPAYAKYVKYQRSLGMEVLFDSESAFITGMSNYGGMESRAAVDNNLLFDSPKAVVYRLNLKYMEKEGVDSFRDK